MERFLNSTGKRVRLLRDDLDLTQNQLLEALGTLGIHISRGRLSQIENSDAPPSGEILRALAAALGTSADYLLLLTDDAVPPFDASTLAEEGEPYHVDDSLVRSLLEAVGRLSRSDQAMLLGIAERLASASQPRIIGGEADE
ncbi:MAG: helix-turn-helix transcriptional regulator [Caldilineaceae bacterium]|nr:helix-turn-helix transcriptional regulator [Caldilineaceae bacterium]MCB9161643.1 helix-turn-helix transcriptional regulator [Caldilineaceae bacterium]